MGWVGGHVLSRGLGVGCVLAFLASARVGECQPLVPADFAGVATQGFGDRQNSIPWSMAWWRGHLYVGTGRSFFCAISATNQHFFPFLNVYPPRNPNVECPATPEELVLAAEIWRWTPETDVWDLVYRSPVDAALPGLPGRFVARSIGFRGMTVFTEPDGTEALYVGGVSARSLFGATLPPPQILRSTDGELFEPLPQQPGTFLGDISAAGFRTLTSFAGRLYAIASNGLLGHGVLVEARDPSVGNDDFRRVSPDGVTFFEMTSYDGALYAGTGVQPLVAPMPYAVMKTTATGEPPYEFTSVITEAAYLKNPASQAVISMHVFDSNLYIGTDRELLRIHPDDSWELIVGKPRDTPEGPKRPLSGLGPGFDHLPNIHIWRMVTHGGWLYVGTQDQSAEWLHVPGLGPFLASTAGFDLYASSNGVDFSPVTRDGFGAPFTTGARVFADTPQGLIVGGANAYYGLKLWRGVAQAPGLAAPTNVEVDISGEDVLLTWAASSEGVKFHVYRDLPFRPFREIGLLSREESSLGSDAFRFVERRPWFPWAMHYCVVAEDAAGNLSPPSPMIRLPVLVPP